MPDLFLVFGVIAVVLTVTALLDAFALPRVIEERKAQYPVEAIEVAA